jgi:hypothetical protein
MMDSQPKTYKKLGLTALLTTHPPLSAVWCRNPFESFLTQVSFSCVYLVSYFLNVSKRPLTALKQWQPVSDRALHFYFDSSSHDY